jgi:para-aminobenzoate synthetase/4-amino-4-deoxychorismate lyase
MQPPVWIACPRDAWHGSVVTMLDPSRPFVLLDDARDDGAVFARLFRDPVEIIVADRLADMDPALATLRAARGRGLHAAGFVGFGAAPAFEQRLPLDPPAADGLPLLWFALFPRVELIAPDAVAGLLGDPSGATTAPLRPLIEPADYAAAFERVQALIAAGDIYQANLTFAAELKVAGPPLALYAALRETSRAGWGAIVRTEDRWVLSASPEQFFSLEGDALRARPMKGTAAPTADPRDLAGDEKERAENLMIVDLLRNDLARVAAEGSVAVPALFEVEQYPTVQQLTSTVTARLADGRDAIDVLAALFPCGSVTGAPKIRAIEVTHAIEPAPRGLYTGAIGHLDPGGDAGFSVAIRTLILDPEEKDARLGLGSGVVADSTAAREWRECLAKGEFATACIRRFDLIETMRFDPVDGILMLDRHLARLAASAAALGFALDRHGARNELQAATFRLTGPARVRLMLARSGRIAIETRPLPPRPVIPAEVAIVPRPVPAGDFRLIHKTSDRGFYDQARTASGRFEVVFVDDQGFLTEGSFTNLFVERDGVLATPPLSRGLLPGVLRAQLIEEGRAVEAELTEFDLARGFLIGNALRGLIPARLVAAQQGQRL